LLTTISSRIKPVLPTSSGITDTNEVFQGLGGGAGIDDFDALLDSQAKGVGDVTGDEAGGGVEEDDIPLRTFLTGQYRPDSGGVLLGGTALDGGEIDPLDAAVLRGDGIAVDGGAAPDFPDIRLTGNGNLVQPLAATGDEGEAVGADAVEDADATDSESAEEPAAS
jgi:hypothetical protein